MRSLPKTSIKVISQKGFCGALHKEGDSWEVDLHTPGGMCLSAWNTIYPVLNVMKFGGTFPWHENSDVETVACPDEKNPVVFEIRKYAE